MTPKQQRFAELYLELGNASEAYRRSYQAGNMTAVTINKRASELLADGGISGWVEAARAKAADEAVVTLEGHLRELAAIRDEARAAGQFGAAVAAETARAKHAGITRPDKHEVTGKDGEPIAVTAEPYSEYWKRLQREHAAQIASLEHGARDVGED